MIVTGRTLDEDGNPVPGTGFELDEDGWLADLLRERAGPVRSHPTRGIWSAPLQTPRGDGDQMRVLSLFEPGYAGPPEHYHEVSEGRFDVRQGSFTFSVDGVRQTVSAGETLTVERGTRHTFGYDGDALGVSVTTVEPPGRIGHVLPTFAGIAHVEQPELSHPRYPATAH
jgi:quercetin dioxygenase-like cupin family protein